jgi:hypothetical protein
VYVAAARSRILRAFMVLSAVLATSESLFLLLARTNGMQIKLGTTECGSSHTLVSVIPLLIGVPILVFLFYFITFLFALPFLFMFFMWRKSD